MICKHTCSSWSHHLILWTEAWERGLKVPESKGKIIFYVYVSHIQAVFYWHNLGRLQAWQICLSPWPQACASTSLILPWTIKALFPPAIGPILKASLVFLLNLTNFFLLNLLVILWIDSSIFYLNPFKLEQGRLLWGSEVVLWNFEPRAQDSVWSFLHFWMASWANLFHRWLWWPFSH